MTIDPEETIFRLELNAARWEMEAAAAGKTPHARELAARRAARCRKLAQQMRAEAASPRPPLVDGA